MSDEDKMKLINQGTYGCIFRPAISCKGNALKSSFITKVQTSKTNSDHETKLGSIIKKIKHYNRYFAPILKSCSISIANIKNDEIKKCNVINEKTTKLISNKMKYVGDKTLLDYFLHILEQKHYNIHETLFDTYLHLLEGIHLLNTNHIVHYDLKENNIMYDETQNYPIIVDFGLSFQDDHLQTYRELKNAFYIYAPEYKPWCFEIHVLSFILHKIDKNHLDNPISLSLLHGVIYDFSEKNSMFEHFTKGNKNIHYINSLKDFLEQYSNLTYRQLIDELLKFHASWDNYSLAVIFLYLIYQVKIHNIHSISILSDFLKQIIFSTPNKRSGIMETIEKVSVIYDENT